MPRYASGPQGFVQWFAVNYPREYRRALNSQPSGMAGLGVWYNPLTWFNVPKTPTAAAKPVPKTAPKPAPAPVINRAATTVTGTAVVAASAAPTNWFTSVWNAVSSAFDTKLQYDKNKLLIQQQLNRAAQGQPPANVPAAAPTASPDPAALDSLIADTTPGGPADTGTNGKPVNNTMLWVLGIGAALLFVPRLIGK